SAFVAWAAPRASVACTACLSRRALRFRRGACRYASLADLYCAVRITFLRGCYHQIFGPRRHPPKLSNGLCRHAGAYVRLNLHLGWQAAESYVERSNAFALIPGHRLLPDCSAAEQPSIEGNSFARHASERGYGTLAGGPRQQVGCSAERFGVALARSNSVILPKAGKPETQKNAGSSQLTEARADSESASAKE